MQRLARCVIVVAVCAALSGIGLVLATTASSRLIEEGNNQLLAQKPDLAMEKFNKAVILSPFSGRAHLYRAIAYARLKQIGTANEDFDAAIRLGVSRDLVLLSQASEQCAQGDYQAAMLSANALFEQGNVDPHVLLVLGICQSKLGAYAEAQNNLTSAIETSHSSELKANALYERALLEHEQKDKRAIKDIEKSLELNQKPVAYLLQGRIRQASKRFGEAVQDYDKILVAEPKNASVFTDRGICYANLQDTQHAIADFTRAVQLDQNCLESYIQRGNIYFDTGHYKQAVADFQVAHKLSPSLAEVNTKLQIAQSKLE
jgi:tetratricopeptide (TPR) repeat protein